MLLALVLVLIVIALAVAAALARWVLKQDNGTPEMRVISDAIQEGAEAFLRRQYRTIGLLSTHPHGPYVTDSAAAASAMSIGRKVANGAI